MIAKMVSTAESESPCCTVGCMQPPWGSSAWEEALPRGITLPHICSPCTQIDMQRILFYCFSVSALGFCTGFIPAVQREEKAYWVQCSHQPHSLPEGCLYVALAPSSQLAGESPTFRVWPVLPSFEVVWGEVNPARSRRGCRSMYRLPLPAH